jgi:hypothetical protein
MVIQALARRGGSARGSPIESPDYIGLFTSLPNPALREGAVHSSRCRLLAQAPSHGSSGSVLLSRVHGVVQAPPVARSTEGPTGLRPGP